MNACGNIRKLKHPSHWLVPYGTTLGALMSHGLGSGHGHLDGIIAAMTAFYQCPACGLFLDRLF